MQNVVIVFRDGFDQLGRQTSDRVTALGANVDGSVLRIAGQLGIGAESLRRSVAHAEIDTGSRAGLTTEDKELVSGTDYKITDYSSFAACGEPQTTIPSVAPVFAHPEETLRSIAERMATCGFFAMPVVEHGTRKLLGLVSAEELLKGRERAHARENKHERLRMPFRRMRSKDILAETA